MKREIRPHVIFTPQSCSDSKEVCKKSVTHVQSSRLFCVLNSLLFRHARYRRRRWILGSRVNLERLPQLVKGWSAERKNMRWTPVETPNISL